MRKISKYFIILVILGLLLSLLPSVPVMADVDFDLSVSKGPVGTEVTLEGSDLEEISSNDYEEIDNITFDDDDIDFDVDYDDDEWEATIEIPEYPYGKYTIEVTSDQGNSSTASFTVTSKITLSKTSGQAGTTIDVEGTGFSDDDDVKIVLDSTTTLVSDAETDGDGSFEESITIPSTASTGSHTIKATDGDSHTYSATFAVTASASITLSKATGTVGNSVTVTGAAFTASQSVSVNYDGTSVGQTTASSAGAWSVTFTVPASATGSHTIEADGLSKYFTITPVITLNKNSAPAGSTITVTGSGFGSGESGISITYDGTAIGQPITASSTGGWTSTVTIPAGTAGAHNIGAINASGSPVGTTVPFTLGAGFSIDKASGLVGDSLKVSGNGFAASEKVNVTIDNTAVASNVPADANGTWSTTLALPSLAGGDHVINASGTTTKSASSTGLAFTINPNVTITPSEGSIKITGTGFAANEKNISISFNDSVLKDGITASAKGDWSATVTLPMAAAGSHDLVVAGPTSGNVGSGELRFKVEAQISTSLTSGNVGSEVNIKGQGFAINSQIKIYYDDTDVSNGRITTDAAGSFSKSIAIPASKGGSHTIQAQDAQGNSADAEFVMDSTPPDVPKVVSPTDGSRISLFGNITPTLKWSSITDPSGVVYSIQLDSDPEFSEPLEKSSLTANKYTLNKSEALPRGEYYWRIRAIDGAGNESAWSTPVVLKSGSMSPALFIFLILLAVIAICAILYFLVIPRLIRRRAKAAQATATAPEIVIPEIVNAEYRTIEAEDASKKRALPWRLALPQAPQPAKGSKTLSSEDQARLKVIVDFAKSLPLPQPDATTSWLIEMAESSTGETPSPDLYGQLLKGEIQVRYEPAWMRHPTYMDLQELLEGQPILQDLNSFVDSLNRATTETTNILQDIYKETSVEMSWDILNNGGWGFVAAVYSDSFSWYQGKYLREPSEREYNIKSGGNASEGSEIQYELIGETNTPFAGLLIKANGETEAAKLRTLHLKLRRSYRNNDKTREIVNMIAHLEVQRSRLLNAFNQFNRLTN